MRSLRHDKFGAPTVLAVEEIPTPAPGADEVLVRVKASGINRIDVAIVSGAFDSPVPRTPGRDFAGIVVADEREAGREVWGSGAGFGMFRDGAQAEYVVVRRSWLADKPERLTMAQAAANALPFVTAWAALIDAGDLKPTETVFLNGAAGAVGRAATQIAHWNGARVIGSAGHGDVPEVDELVDTSVDGWPEAVRDFTRGRGVDLALDSVGGAMFQPTLKTLANFGRQVTIAGRTSVGLDLADFYHRAIRLYGVDTRLLSGDAVAVILNDLRAGFDGGQLHPLPIVERPLDEAGEAYAAVAAGSSARQVLMIG